MKEIELIRMFAPILHFHPRESTHCCFPSDAEETYSKYHRDWNKFPVTKMPKVLDKNTPCYFEIWNEPAFTQIRYWFWYNYNDFPDTYFGLGDHIGDWEHVEIRLYGGNSIDDGIWLLSNHKSARLTSVCKSLPRFNLEPPIFEDCHLHVWVALGSHANYPSPTSKPRCYARLFCDEIMDNGEIWYTQRNLKRINDTNFATYTGRWGDNKAPRSPTNQYNNRWRNAPNAHPIHVFSEG